MRVFLGIDAHSLVIDPEKLKKLKIGLKSHNIEHRFVSQDQLNIQLINIGDVHDSFAFERDGYINNIIQSYPSFELKLTGLSAYPSAEEGRLLWIGVQNSRTLRALQAELSQQIPSICDLDFKPLMPIVRLRNYKNMTDIISPYKNFDFGKLVVESIVAYEMISGGAFPVIKPLKRYYLSNHIEETSSSFMA